MISRIRFGEYLHLTFVIYRRAPQNAMWLHATGKPGPFSHMDMVVFAQRMSLEAGSISKSQEAEVSCTVIDRALSESRFTMSFSKSNISCHGVLCPKALLK